MKKSILFFLVIASCTAVFAQDRNNYNDNRNYNARGEVPNRVYNRFHNDYPDVQNAQWDRSGRHWHATYRDQGNRNIESYYDKRGRQIDRHIAWDRSNLPSDYDQRIYNRYHTKDYEVYRIERQNNPAVFQLSLNLGTGRRTIYTDETGNEIRYRDRH